MKLLSYISFALCCLLSTTACIEEDLDACPSEGGGVTVTLRAEKFRTRPPYGASDFEEVFTQRIRSLDYQLYADGRLLEQGRLAVTGDGGSYLFHHDILPFGSYRICFAANTEPGRITGDVSAPERSYIPFLGEPKDEDYFRADLPFDVTCPYRNEFETVLRRVHGVTRFRFDGIPAEVTAVEVSLDKVGERMPLSGDPDRSCLVAKRISVADLETRSEGSFLLGTFPTLPGMRSAWRLKLYGKDAAVPIYDRLVTDTLRIESNQLLELRSRFNEGGIEFSVDVDTTWDGSNESGGEVTVS